LPLVVVVTVVTSHQNTSFPYQLLLTVSDTSRHSTQLTRLSPFECSWLYSTA